MFTLFEKYYYKLFKVTNFNFFYSFFYKLEILKIIRDGFHIDSITKKLLENFLKKIFIYSGIFFGEKYIMEGLGPKLVENFIWTFKNKFFFEHISIITLFYQVIFILFLFNLYINLFFLIVIFF